MALTGSQKAYKFALSGVMRSGTSRSGYVTGTVFISIGGVPLVPSVAGAHTGIALGSLSITDSLDEVPNRCTFRTINSVPTTGQEVIITLGSKNRADRLFAGHVLSVEEVLGGTQNQIRANVSCVDYTWQLGFQKVTARYTGQSGTAIAHDLIATYAAANGFNPGGITPDLPGLDEITFTNEDLPDAFTRLARRLGAYWYVDYRKVVHLFFEEEQRGRPFPVYTGHPSLSLTGFSSVADRSQALTRVYVEGRGTRILATVTAGDTIIPVEAVDMFPALNVGASIFLKASFQGSDGGAQHLTFSGAVPGGSGSVVGPGVAATSPPVVARAAGLGIEIGAHDYAYTWVTASGETKPSPLARVTHVGAPATPTTSTTVTHAPNGHAVDELTAGAWKPGDTVQWAYSWAYSPAPATGTPLSPAASRVAVADPENWWHTPGQSAKGMQVLIPYSPDANIKYVFIWHRVNAGTWRVWYAGSGFTNYPGGSAYTVIFDLPGTYATVVTPPVSATAGQRTDVSGIAVGPTAVTSRKLYRTVANGAPLKLLTTLANNTATTHTDAAADATLGANAPAADTSALSQPTGTVLPHAPTIPVSSAAAFVATGGWAIIGNGEQVIRYGNVAGNNLGLVTIDGPGSVVAPVEYGSTITAAPMVTGIPASGTRSILRPLTAGDELYLVVQLDDTARQAQLAAVMGGNGIREEWIQDRRLSFTEAGARGQATLKVRPLDQATVTYRCYDITTAAGKTIEINLTPVLASPINVVGYFKIQQVTIDNFRHVPTQYPTYTVQASSTRFSFEDWLRRIPTRT